MDLGFGAHNQDIGSATAQALLQGAQQQEENLNAELAQFDKLLDDEEGLEALRERRLAQLQQQQSKLRKYKALGHGTYDELGGGSRNDTRDVAKDFFEASKASDRMVIHFYRPTTRYCDVFHAHLEKMARKHMETRFLKLSVEDCDHQGGGASFLVERLGVVVMPTLVLVKDRKVLHLIQGFDELGGTDEFSEQTLAFVLGSQGVIDPREDEEVPEDVFNKSKGVNAIRIQKGARNGFHTGEDEFE